MNNKVEKKKKIERWTESKVRQRKLLLFAKEGNDPSTIGQPKKEYE